MTQDAFVRRSDIIDDVLVITPRRFGDARGFFSETWNRRALEQAKVDLPVFVQDNHSLSQEKGTVRALHYQSPPHAQGKLVRCGRGRIFDVAVDIRVGSPTYGKWHAEELSFENGRQLWVPPGFLHGFQTLEDDTEIHYKCTAHYAPECDNAVMWDSLDIPWPIKENVILSDKDRVAGNFSDLDSPFVFEGR